MLRLRAPPYNSYNSPTVALVVLLIASLFDGSDYF